MKDYIRKLLQASAKRKAVRNIKARGLLQGQAILYSSTSGSLVFFVFGVEAFQFFPPQNSKTKKARALSPYFGYVQDDMQISLFMRPDACVLSCSNLQQTVSGWQNRATVRAGVSS